MYRDWVAQLASQLRDDGVDARLDRWHLQRGQSIPEFMNSEKSIQPSDSASRPR